MSCYCNFVCSEPNMEKIKVISKSCCSYCSWSKTIGCKTEIFNKSYCNYCYRSHYLEHKYFILWKLKLKR